MSSQAPPRLVFLLSQDKPYLSCPLTSSLPMSSFHPLLFPLPCPPLCDLLSAFLHAPGHCTVQGAQGFLRLGLNNIHKEMDEVLFMCCPLLCSLKPAGRDETNFIAFPWTWWNHARKIIFLVLICGPEQQTEIADFSVDVMQLRLGDWGWHSHTLNVEGCVKIGFAAHEKLSHSCFIFWSGSLLYTKPKAHKISWGSSWMKRHLNTNQYKGWGVMWTDFTTICVEKESRAMLMHRGDLSLIIKHPDMLSDNVDILTFSRCNVCHAHHLSLAC